MQFVPPKGRSLLPCTENRQLISLTLISTVMGTNLASSFSLIRHMKMHGELCAFQLQLSEMEMVRRCYWKEEIMGMNMKGPLPWAS